MKLIDALKKIEELRLPLFTTQDVAGCLRVPSFYASKVLARLEKARHVIRLVRGKWARHERIDRLLLPEFLTFPWPAYISLQTALYHHGMIDQIPSVIYAISLSRTKRYNTPLGTFSIHQVQPEFFFGFELAGVSHIKIATPEKALVDFFYMGTGKAKMFKSLPELEIPKDFSRKKAFAMAQKIPSPLKRKVVAAYLKQIS